MSHHDEHGRVDVNERDHGPEWWAMDREYCICGHHYDEHGRDDNIDDPDPGEPCGGCGCVTFRAQSTLDTPQASA